MKLTRSFFALLAALALLVAACGDGDDEETDAGSDTEEAADAEDTASEDDADTGETESDDDADTDDSATDDGADGGEASCAVGLTKVEGTLTVATGEPVFPPWMIDDDPSNGEGFESAVVYALAEKLGITSVEWVRTGFDEAVAPGEKDYDFNIQQYSIIEARDEVVDFSDGYYQVEQAIIGAADSPAATATSLAELRELRLGAAVGTTSLAYVDDVIQPNEDAAVYDDNAAAKAAFDAGQVDAIVFDLPTAYFITAEEIPEASIIGVLPRSGAPEELGMLFEEGSELVPCINEALAELVADGTIEELEETWLNQGGDIPSLTE
jgi:polar amino acid transport system substrate-binding protein